MKAIEEELEMMRGTNITTQVLKYLDDLMHTYKKLEHFMSDEDDENDKDLIKGTMVDERLDNALDEVQAYCDYKKSYNKTHKQTDLDMAKDELSHFLQALVDTFEEIENLSRDDMEDRATIKKYIKQIYQNFN